MLRLATPGEQRGGLLAEAVRCDYGGWVVFQSGIAMRAKLHGFTLGPAYQFLS